MIREGKQFQRTEDGHLILMSPDDRKLLITDLTARIEYGVICMIERADDFGPMWRNEKLTGFCNEENGSFYFDFGYGMTVDFAEKVKPYLRPMSSMTEDEESRMCAFLDDIEGGVAEVIPHYVDWLNKHYLDYHGLIDKGLALVASEEMYEIVSPDI